MFFYEDFFSLPKESHEFFKNCAKTPQGSAVKCRKIASPILSPDSAPQLEHPASIYHS
jgi:hypothetical protein